MAGRSHLLKLVTGNKKKSETSQKSADAAPKETAKVVNKTGLKLDMDDLQNESDEDMDTGAAGEVRRQLGLSC